VTAVEERGSAARAPIDARRGYMAEKLQAPLRAADRREIEMDAGGYSHHHTGRTEAHWPLIVEPVNPTSGPAGADYGLDILIELRAMPRYGGCG